MQNKKLLIGTVACALIFLIGVCIIHIRGQSRIGSSFSTVARNLNPSRDTLLGGESENAPDHGGLASSTHSEMRDRVFQLEYEVDLNPVVNEVNEMSEAEREIVESQPVREVYRRFKVVHLDWDAIKKLSSGAHISFPLPSGLEASGTINLVDRRPGEPFGIGGSLSLGMEGSFSLTQDPLVGVRGFLLPSQGEVAYVFVEEQGDVFMDEVDKGSVLCYGMPKPQESPHSAGMISVGGSGKAGNPAVPLYQSRPGALGVLYIDLDGEVVTDPKWNSGSTINATAPVFSSVNTILKIWQEVSEAYAPFYINVTTDVSVYNSATPGRRMRIIVTSNNWIGAGGVALLSSFQWSGTTPCWCFNGASNLDQNIHLTAMTISHEFGHTFGLWHDGLLPANPNSNNIGAYYQGHFTPVGGWGPIMGAPFYFSGGYPAPIRPIVQWSKGQYAGTNASSSNIFTLGNNTQDDVGIISGPANQCGYVQDDFANTITDSTAIPQDPVGSGNISVPQGLIHADNDVDVFRIGQQSGNLLVNASNAPSSPNLKIRLTLINPDGVTTNTIADPTNQLTASINASLPAGDYYLRVEGVGTTTDNATTNGFVGYGSIGQYSLSGTFQNVPKPDGDYFAQPILLPSTATFALTCTALGAGAEAFEKSYVSGKARKTIWFSWVAPGSGYLTLDTMGSGYNTTLAVCTGTSLTNLKLIAANNDATSGVTYSKVRFLVAAGVPYYFVVDSFDGTLPSGLLVLNGSGALFGGIPANDNFASPSNALIPASNSGSLLGATAEINEPSLAGIAATRSVWFSYTPAGNGRLTLDTSNSACDTVLGIYTGEKTGTNWSNLKLLAANDNITPQNTYSWLTLMVTNGVNYRIKVDSRVSTNGSYNLNGKFEPTPTLVSPTGLKFVLNPVKGQNYQPSISWGSVKGALGYEISLLRYSTRIYTAMRTTTNWTNGPVLVVSNQGSSAYGAQVRAISNNIYSPWSAVVPASIGP